MKAHSEKRCICIHGHFYQPPRENPWLEAIELQDSAYPYHDWNERITAECYRPNAAARILDSEGLIERILNNYSRISFNFGPTLLGWMEEQAPDVYQAILRADDRSRERFSGHGSALAQVYNHMIMPLAARQDKITQVRWGIEDFRHRFGRDPEGMWLAETAVDLETLEILRLFGIRFTILSPYQAESVLEPGEKEWQDVSGGRIDPRIPYLQKLPSGDEITIFFYDGPVSQAIAFERLLARGDDLANRLLGAFSELLETPQLVHIATDGETYGHHHRHGEMALAYALQCIEREPEVHLTNYAEFLSLWKAELPRVEIIENSSWSCVHGVERWRSDCGCNSGRKGWNQKWRAPLRAALDWLREELASIYQQEAGRFFEDPWKARDHYISVILDRSPDSTDRFIDEHCRRGLDSEQRIRLLKLLEMQRQSLLMYTSCGWFFDDLSGIETVQVIGYAGRAVQLARELRNSDAIEESFLHRLEKAVSNIAEHGNGRRIYEKWVKPAQLDLVKVCGHFAASSLFESYPDQSEIYAFRIMRQDYQSLESGRSRLATGRCKVTSKITEESMDFAFATMHLGDHNLTGGVSPFEGTGGYLRMVRQLCQTFSAADIPETVREMDRQFTRHRFSLKTLFRDEQRKIVNLVLDATLTDAESIYRRLFDQHGPLMNFLHELGAPIPAPFRVAAEMVITADLRRLFQEEELDQDFIEKLLQKAETWQAHMDREGLSYLLEQRLQYRARQVSSDREDQKPLERLEKAVDLAHRLPFEVDLSQAQNEIYEMIEGGCLSGDKSPWKDGLKKIAEKLSIRTP